MTLAPRLRTTLLASGLALTLVAIGWVETRDERVATTKSTGTGTGSADAKRRAPAKGADAPAVAESTTTPAAQTGPTPAVDLARARRAVQPLAGDAFEPRSWAPPPRKQTAAERAAAAPPPPPPPEAPPLPFRYIGMLGNDGRTTLFLSSGDRDVAAKPGDVIDGVWRLELVNEQRALFVYVPLQQSRTLTLGAR